MKEPATENKPAIVGKAGESPAFPTQAGETPARWAWVERRVWTERMLKRLETSQEQTVWYSLWDKVWQPDNLAQAIVEVIGNRGSAGVDGQTTQQFKADWTCQQERLQQELRSGRYPNAWFAAQGLFSLKAAQAQWLQSLIGNH